jgi:hypothetical protein
MAKKSRQVLHLKINKALEAFAKALLALVPWVILIPIVKIINVFEMAKRSRQVLHLKINKASEAGFC